MLEKLIGKYRHGLSLINQEQYQEAYDEFTRLIEHNPNDYKARAYRGILSAIYLNHKDEQIYSDLTMGIKAPASIAERLYSLYSNVCMNLQKYDEAIVYAQKAVEKQRAIDINYLLLVRFYLYEIGDDEHLELALSYIEYLENNNENNPEYMMLKADILLHLGEAEEAKPYIDKLFFSSTHQAFGYLLKGDSYLSHDEVSKEDYQNAMKYYHDALTVSNNQTDPFTIYLKICEVHKQLEEFPEVLEICEKILLNDKENSYALFHKAWALANMGQVKEAIAFSEEHLNSLDDIFTSRRFLALWILSIAASKEDYEKVIFYAKEALTDYDSPILYSLIIQAAEAIYDFSMVKEAAIALTKYKEEAYGHYILSAVLFKEGNPDYLKSLEKAAKIDPIYYLDYSQIIYDRSKPNTKKYEKNTQFLQAQIREGVKEKNHWCYRLMGIGYLYGTYGYSLAPEIALKYIEVDLQAEELQEESTACDYSLYGASLLRMGLFDKAYQAFLTSYTQFRNYRSSCSCGSAFLARMYLEGQYVQQNMEKAKEITLEIIAKEDKYLHSNSALLYAYFALLKEPGFDLKEAIDYCHQVEKETYSNSRFYYFLALLYEQIGNQKLSNQYSKKIAPSLQGEAKYIRQEMKKGLASKSLFLPPFHNL